MTDSPTGASPTPAAAAAAQADRPYSPGLEGVVAGETSLSYVYGANGYANDKSGEPAENTTSHVKKDTWTTMRLDLDGPYGFHTMTGAFKPEDVAIWGIHLNTWGCP